MKKNIIREAKVLKSLVNEYISTNETVASSLLCKKYINNASPATVRIDLHKLEKKGLIFQPHTSAGRIPTLSGFRKYLELIKDDLAQTEYQGKDIVRDFLVKNFRDIPMALHYIMQYLAKETDQLSFVAEPEISYGYLKKLDVFKVSDKKLLFVVSLDSGMDKTVLLNSSADISEQQLKVLVRYANDELMGLRIYDILNHYLAQITDDMTSSNKLLITFLTELYKAFREITNYFIHFDGNISFLEQPEFNEKKNILVFFDLMQRQDFLVNKMQENLNGKDYSIALGEDFGRPEWLNFSLVFAKYELFDVPGFLGILAPIRMNYIKNVPIVRDIAKMITETTKKGMMVPRYEK